MTLDHLNDQQKLDLAMEGITSIDYGLGRSLQEAISEEYGVDISEEVADTLEVLDMEVLVAEPGDDVEKLSEKERKPGTLMQVHEILIETRETGGDVYMGVKLHPQKASIVWDLGRDNPGDDTINYVVQMPGAEWYDRFERTFDWTQLSEIKLGKVHKYDISTTEYNNLVTEIDEIEEKNDGTVTKGRADPTPPEEEELNISVSRKHTEQTKLYAKQIKDQFEADESLSIRKSGSRSDSVYDVDTILLFPSGADHKISNHYWLGGDGYMDRTVAVANCNVGTYEYLADVDGIYHIDKFIANSWRKSIETSEGETCIANTRDELVLHVTGDEIKPIFSEVRDRMVGALRIAFETDTNKKLKNRDWEGPDYGEMAYAPVTWGELFKLLPAVREANVHVIWGDATKPSMVNMENRKSLTKDVWVYALARLNEWRETPEMNALLRSKNSGYLSRMTSFPNLQEGGYELIETLAEVHDDGRPPVSAT